MKIGTCVNPLKRATSLRKTVSKPNGLLSSSEQASAIHKLAKPVGSWNMNTHLDIFYSNPVL
jgi:hypothetical protein